MRVKPALTVGAFLTVAATIGVITSSSFAQKAPTPFCKGWKAISHDPRADRTGTGSDTFAHVKRVADHNMQHLFNCVGVIAVGVGKIESDRVAPAHSWILAIEVRKNQMPAKEGPSSIEGVRIELVPIAHKSGEPELL